MSAGSILSKVENLLQGKELTPQAGSFLLLRLCQFAQYQTRERSLHYFELLKSYQDSLPSDLRTDFIKLQESLEPGEKPSKGFSLEMIEEIKNTSAITDQEQKKSVLINCEKRLNKRILPFGKEPVWAALVDAWSPIDREHTVDLIARLPVNTRESFIIQLNNKSVLSPENWGALVKQSDLKKMALVAYKILEDGNAELLMPVNLAKEVGRIVLDRLREALDPEDMLKTKRYFELYEKLLSTVPSEQLDLVLDLIEAEFIFLVNDPFWNKKNHYQYQFRSFRNLLIHIRSIRERMKNLDIGALVSRLETKLPPHWNPSYIQMKNFLQAESALWYIFTGEKELVLIGDTPVSLRWKTISASEIREVFKNQVLFQYNSDVEAWFLVSLITFGGMEEMAFELARNSPNKGTLLPRMVRCWLVYDPVQAREYLQATSLQTDSVSVFLMQKGSRERGEYLRQLTNQGTLVLPPALWVNAARPSKTELQKILYENLKPEARKDFDSLKNSEYMLEFAAVGYILNFFLSNNPLFGIVYGDGRADNFTHFLVYDGYEQYSYHHLDVALRDALVAWGDEYPQEVRNLLHLMWKEMIPMDTFLKADLLRNAIFERCRTVLAADPDTLINDCISWVQEKLVTGWLTVVDGQSSYTLRFPEDMPLKYCVISASSIQEISTARSDQIILHGLKKFPHSEESVRLAAQVYSAHRERLDENPPMPLSYLSAWQIGVIQAALSEILNAMISEPDHILCPNSKPN